MDPERQPPRLLTMMGFTFLTFNSGLAVYRSAVAEEPWGTAFALFSYVNLVLLFRYLRMFERGAHDSPRRRRVLASVWTLTTLLTAMFCWKVATIMPLPVAVLVWAMGGATVIGGFYAFFVHMENI